MNDTPKAYAFPFLVLLLVYAVWIGFQYAMAALGGHGASDGPLPELLVLASGILTVFVGAFLATVFVVHTEAVFSKRPRARAVCTALILTLGLATSFVIQARGVQAPFLHVIHSVTLLMLAVLVGGWLATAVQRAAEMVVLCSLLLWVDLLSVLAGPSRWVSDTLSQFYRGGRVGEVPWADLLLVKTLVPGAGMPYPLFGVSDWIIVVFLSVAAAKFGINDNLAGRSLADMAARRRLSPYFSVPAAGLTAALVVAHLLDTFVPALSVIAILYVAYLYRRHRPRVRLERRDRTAIVLPSVVAVAILTARLLH